MRRRRPHRLHPEAYSNPENQFHLTFRAHPRFDEWPGPVRDAVWPAILNERTRDSIRLFATCLMPNHLHLLVAPAARDVVGFVNGSKAWTTRQAWQAGVAGPIWQPGMWDRTIRDEQDFDEVANYIVRNPVAAGLAGTERDWPHTWVYWWEPDADFVDD